jgi:hypothetical protein
LTPFRTIRIAVAVGQELHPGGETVGLGETAEEVDVMLLDEKVAVVNGDAGVGSGTQTHGFDLHLAVEQFRGKRRVFGDDSQGRRALILRERESGAQRG